MVFVLFSRPRDRVIIVAHIGMHGCQTAVWNGPAIYDLQMTSTHDERNRYMFIKTPPIAVTSTAYRS